MIKNYDTNDYIPENADYPIAWYDEYIALGLIFLVLWIIAKLG